MKKVRTKQRGACAATCAMLRTHEREALRAWRVASKAPMNRLSVDSKRAPDGASGPPPRARTVRCVPVHALNVLARGAVAQLHASHPEFETIANGGLASASVSDAAAFRAQLAVSSVLQAIVELARETQARLGDSSKRLRANTVKMAARTVFARLGEPSPLDAGALGATRPASSSSKAARSKVVAPDSAAA